MPDMGDADLWDLTVNTGMPEPSVRYFAKCLLNAIVGVNGAGYVHRDIKPENVLLYEHLTPLLADFGSAAKISNQSQEFDYGTTGW